MYGALMPADGWDMARSNFEHLHSYLVIWNDE